MSRGPVQPPAHSLWQHSLGLRPKHRKLHWGAHTVFVTAKDDGVGSPRPQMTTFVLKPGSTGWTDDRVAWPDKLRSEVNPGPKHHHKLWGFFCFWLFLFYFMFISFCVVDIWYSFSTPGVKVLKSLTDLAHVPPWTPARNVSTCFVTRF